MRSFTVLVLAAGCASHFKTERVGNGFATIQPRGSTHAPIASGITLPQGTYDLALAFDIPRAQQIEWVLTCPGQTLQGSLGETFESYRTRRLAELRAQRERDRQNVSAVTGLLVGAVAPTMRAHAEGPNGSADAVVDGHAVGTAAGQAVADATVDPNVQLAPGDVGQGRLHTRVHVVTDSDGVCSVVASADDPQVMGHFEVTRIRDLDAEARQRAIAAETSARQTRVAIVTQLTGYGADPELRAKQLAERARKRAQEEAERTRLRVEAQLAAQAEAERRARLQAQIDLRADLERRQRLEAEARIRLEAEARATAERNVRLQAEARVRADAELVQRREYEARIAIETRQREAALSARGELIAYLGQCGADPNHRERVRAEARAREEARLRIEFEARQAREARLRIERERRDAELRAQVAIQEENRRKQELFMRAQQERIAALEAHRVELAFATRASLRAYLISLGAKERPPMPAPLPENPGATPFDGAQWIAGRWIWEGGQWRWQAGGWTDAHSFADAGGEITVGTSFGIGIGTSTSVDSSVRDHRTYTPSRPVEPTPTIRDHRSEPARHTEDKPTVRDHRKTKDDDDDKKKPTPTVRDHRR